MDAKKVIQEFYREFESMNLKGVVAFFAPHAMVHSPVLGKKDPQAFYAELFSLTKAIKINLKDIFVNPDKPHRAAAYLTFTMETKKRESMSFDGVVIFELNAQGKIQSVEIIYDAERARKAMAA